MIIGIDPGQKGGMTILWRSEIIVSDLPIENKELNLKVLEEYLSTWNDPYIGFPHTEIWIEKLWGRAGWSATALFRYAELYGVLQGFFWRYGKINFVPAKTWKKEILGNPNATKQDAIEYAKTLCPEYPWKTKDDGKAESVCIAKYGDMMYNI